MPIISASDPAGSLSSETASHMVPRKRTRPVSPGSRSWSRLIRAPIGTFPMSSLLRPSLRPTKMRMATFRSVISEASDTIKNTASWAVWAPGAMKARACRTPVSQSKEDDHKAWDGQLCEHYGNAGQEPDQPRRKLRVHSFVLVGKVSIHFLTVRSSGYIAVQYPLR